MGYRFISITNLRCSFFSIWKKTFLKSYLEYKFRNNCHTILDLDHPKIWIQFSLNFLHLRVDNEILQPFLQRCSCKISFQSLPPSPSQLLSCIFKTPKSLSRKLHSCERPSETPIARPFTCTLLHSLLIRKRRKKSLDQSLHLVNYPPPPPLTSHSRGLPLSPLASLAQPSPSPLRP